MSMIQHQTRAFVSPGKYIQGRYELNNLCEYTSIYGENVLIIIDTFFFASMQPRFAAMYATLPGTVQIQEFAGEITDAKITAISQDAKAGNPQVVVGIGGGKMMDASKAIAHQLHAAVIVVPTTISTDAASSSWSVLYSETGEHLGLRKFPQNPQMVLVDTDIVVNAPVRFMVAGIADALATYLEVRANAASCSPNFIGKGMGLTIAVNVLAKACHETLLAKAVSAKWAAEKHLCTRDFEDIVEANTLLSGLGVENGGCAGAHSVANGFAGMPGSEKLLHGELVAYGILVQLVMESVPTAELHEMYHLFTQLGLPTTLSDLHMEDLTHDQLMHIANHSMKYHWVKEPFPVTAQMVYEAILMADHVGQYLKKY